MLTLFLALASTSPDVAVAIPPTEAGRRLGDQLSAELDEPVRIRTSTLTAADVLALPPFPGVERYLIFADPEQGRIIVVRAADRTLLLRGFDPSRTDAHAMAVAAAELLRLARSSGEPPPPPAEVASAVRSRDTLDVGVSIALGLAVTEAFGHEPLFLQPSIQVGMELEERSSGVWSMALVSVRVPQVRDTTFGDTRIRYRRWEPALVLGVGGVIGDFTLGATLEIGTSITRAEAFASSGELIHREDRLPFWLAAGGLVRYHFGAGFGVQLGASLGGSTSPADYLVKERVALSEGPVRWQATAAASWSYR
jgi:hypothetical protein